MANKQLQSFGTLPEEYEKFLTELGAFMKTVKGLSDSAIRIYLSRIRRLMQCGYSVADLCGASDRLWNDYGPNGNRYDPKDHGNTRAALRHLDDYVRMQLLEQYSGLYISYEQGWQSFRPLGKYESGYTIQNGVITFSYNRGFSACGNVQKKISTTDLRALIFLLESAYKKGCFAASDTCIKNDHGDQQKYSYAFTDVSGNRCACLFEGDTPDVDQLTKRYFALLKKLRA